MIDVRAEKCKIDIKNSDIEVKVITMGHPDRKPKRERRKQRQKMLARRNLYDQTLDLTPYNAVGPMVKGEEFVIKYK
jgi:hypothetical protein